MAPFHRMARFKLAIGSLQLSFFRSSNREFSRCRSQHQATNTIHPRMVTRKSILRLYQQRLSMMEFQTEV